MSHNLPTYASVVEQTAHSAVVGEDNAAIEIDAPFLDEVFSSTGESSKTGLLFECLPLYANHLFKGCTIWKTWKGK